MKVPAKIPFFGLSVLKIGLFFIFLSFFSPSSSLAQDLGDLDDDYVREFIYGINLNSNGGLIGGFMLKGTKIVRPKVYRSIGLEIVGVKNPKELHFQSPSGNNFILGKKNYFFAFRPQYGRDFVLFRKADEEGVQVSANFAAGPSIGLQIPYYILYDRSRQGTIFADLRAEAYDPAIHTNINNIFGPGGFLQGLGESKVLVGINAKIGLSLDFGAVRNSITGVEAGFTFEVFDRAPLIMVSPNVRDPAVKNQQFFTATYLTFFFGSRK
ncbi:MAG: hypothetical protein MUE85_07600 [Microscillaceae bacterium]|jgi:hypothetical protein|nr:hypothetical protein [Microscillaceae bacterium]